LDQGTRIRADSLDHETRIRADSLDHGTRIRADSLDQGTRIRADSLDQGTWFGADLGWHSLQGFARSRDGSPQGAAGEHGSEVTAVLA
jgi:hypothetical protein